MTHTELNKILLAKEGAWIDYPFGADTAVYKVGEADSAKMFALISVNSDPPRISLKCDPQLADTLRQKYESVMPGYHLNKKHWITIVCSGQLDDEEIKALMTHSYLLVTGRATE